MSAKEATPEDIEQLGPAPEVDLNDGDKWGDEQRFRASLIASEKEENPESIFITTPAPEPTSSEQAPADGEQKADEKPAEGKQSADEGEQAPADGEQKADEKPSEVGASSVRMEEMNQFFPGHNFQSADDVRMVGQQFTEAQHTLNTYNELIEKNPVLGDLVAAAANGEAIEDAVVSALPHLQVVEPSKTEEPEKWAEFQLRKKELEDKRKATAAKQSANQNKTKQRQATLRESFGAFSERQGIEKAKLTEVENQLRPFLDGSAFDRGDFFDIIYAGLNREQLIEQARLEGRNEVLEEQRTGKTPATKSNNRQRSMDKRLPLPAQQSKNRELNPPELSDRDKEILQLQNSFQRQGNIEELLTGGDW